MLVQEIIQQRHEVVAAVERLADVYKRQLQDGPTLNGFSFSPRTGFSMPSDGSDALYLATVDALK